VILQPEIHNEPNGLHPEEIGAGGTLWLGRHGEVHNPNEVFYGRLPRYRLSKLGIQHTQETAQFLKDVPLSAAYASPLLRARQTAKAYLQYHPTVKLQINSLLFEVLTQYQGRKKAEVGDFNFYEPKAHADDEDMEDVQKRVLLFTQKVIKQNKGKHVLAVSHGDPVVFFHAHYVNLPLTLKNVRQPNFYPHTASLTRYDFPPEGFTPDYKRVRVTYYNFSNSY
jgi:broad specificity phosphatase PhoE